MTEPMTPEDREVLAGEFALGLLVGSERVEAMRLMLSDTEFAGLVAAWQARLAPLYDGYAAEPPADLWPRIEAGLAERERDPDIVRLKRRVARWRGGAVAAGVAALAAISVLWLRPAQQVVPPPPTVSEPAKVEPAVIAQLAGDAPQGPQVVARYFPASGSMAIRTLGIPQGDLAPELWVVPADGVPRSLGLIAAAGDSRIAIDAALQSLIAEGATLAITMEEPAGAPHVSPTSPIIASGQVAAI